MLRHLPDFIHSPHQRRVFFPPEIGLKSRAKPRIHSDEPQALLAVWLLVDYAVDVERPEDGSCVFVGKHDHTMAAWRDLSMIDCGNRILVTIRCPDAE